MRIFSLLFVGLVFSLPISAEWTQSTTKTLSWLRSVHFLDERIGWIAGSNGVLLSTADGGLTWTESKIRPAVSIMDVHVASDGSVWLLTDRGLNFSRYGDDWNPIALDGKTISDSFVRLAFDSSLGSGFAVGQGGAIIRIFRDRTTERIHLPTRVLILDGETLKDRTVFVGGLGTVLTTIDNGESWVEGSVDSTSRPKLSAVDFVDEKNGWTCGNSGRIYFSSDSGRSWKAQNSGVEVDLLDIAFLNSKIGVAVGVNGVVVTTIDGGKIWKREILRTRSRLERIAFAGRKAVVVGYGGLILTNEF